MINCALFKLRYASIIGDESLKAEIILCPARALFCRQRFLTYSTFHPRLNNGGSVLDLTLYNNETFEMMARRWGKLEKDFKPRHTDRQAENGGGGIFDISKIPDIYDCIKYDTLHNPHLPLPNKNELYAAAKALADVIVPQVTKDDYKNKTLAMHREIFRLQLPNNTHLIENYLLGKTQFTSDLTSKFAYSAVFRNSASSVVKHNIKY